MFIGILFGSRLSHCSRRGTRALLGRQILGNGPFYYFIQVATLLILLLAATSFCGLSQTLLLFARDGFCPRQLSLLASLSLLERYYSPQSLCCCFSRYLPGVAQLFLYAVVYLLHLPCPKWDGAGSNSGHRLAG